MPEGDTLFRTAAVLRDILLDRTLISARGRPGGAQLERLVGRRIVRVESIGKHLLIDVDGGLSLHTHLGLHGSWHRYRSGEPWRRGATRAVAVLEVTGAVAVCFDAPTVELMETRALGLHPVLRVLGPDLVTSEAPTDALVGRLRALPPASSRSGRRSSTSGSWQGSATSIAARCASSSVSIHVDPWTRSPIRPWRAWSRPAGALIRANRMAPGRTTMPGARRPGERLWVYGRAGRPCRRCGDLILSLAGGDPPRRAWWCPTCQSAVSV